MHCRRPLVTEIFFPTAVYPVWCFLAVFYFILFAFQRASLGFTTLNSGFPDFFNPFVDGFIGFYWVLLGFTGFY